MKKIRYKTKNIVLLLILLPVSMAFSQNTKRINADSLFVEARKNAFNKEYITARQQCDNIILNYPDYWDAYILKGRTLAWDKEAGLARELFNKVIESKPTYKDTYLAAIDNEVWSGNNDKAIDYIDKALVYYPIDEDILLQKAKILIKQGKTEEAVEVLNQILAINSTNQEAINLLNSLNERKFNNKLSLYYSYLIFEDDKNNAHLAFVEYFRRTKFGPMLLRTNYTNRFSENDYQLEADAYPTLKPGTYMYLNAGISSNILFPRYRAGFEIFQKLPNAFEVSLGYRGLYFDSENVNIATGSVSKYYRDFWFSLRPFVAVKENLTSYTAQFNARKYLSTSESFVGIVTTWGNSPERIEFTYDVAKTKNTNNYLLGIEYQQKWNKKWISKIGYNFHSQEYFYATYKFHEVFGMLTFAF